MFREWKEKLNKGRMQSLKILKIMSDESTEGSEAWKKCSKEQRTNRFLGDLSEAKEKAKSL